MPFTITWDEAYPAGSDLAADIDLYIQEDKKAVRERMESLLGIADFSTRFPMSADAFKMNGAANTKILGGTASWAVTDSTGAVAKFTVDTVTGGLTTGTINGQTISATASFTGSVNVVGAFTVNTNKVTVDATTGNTVIAGTLGITSDVAVNTNKFTVAATTGNTLVAGTLDATGNFAVNTNKFTVDATTGNSLVAGTLSATGDFAVNTNKFTVAASNGNTAVLGDFAVNTNKFTVAASTGNITVAGTSLVSGVATFTLPIVITDANVAGYRSVVLRNTNTGASGAASISVENSGTYTGIFHFSTGFTPSGTNLAAGGALTSSGAGGLSVGAVHASGVLRLYSHNTLAVTFTGTATAFAGTMSVGASTISGKITNSFNGGGDYVAYFRNLATATPYTVQIQEPSGATSGYSLLWVGSNGGTAWLDVKSGGAATFGSTLTITGVAAVAGAAVSSSTGMVFPVGTTALSSLRIPHGAAPTSPVDGDVWTTTAGLFIQINGVTKTVTLT